MKIRRMLATAVAAAVTTPVVLLSAGPAFAETPKPAAPKGATALQDEPDGPDYAELERLEAAFAAAEQKVEDLTAELEQRLKDVDANAVDPALKTELDAAKAAADEAAEAATAAEAELATAKEALAAVEADANATEEQKTAAAAAVTAAEAKVAQAAEAKTTADTRHKAADKAYDDAMVALTTAYNATQKALEVAEKELTAAEDALDAFWEDYGEFEECVVDESVQATLTGPKTLTIGSTADFSLTVENAADRDLDSVVSVVSAVQLPESWDDIDEEFPNLGKYFTVQWKTGDGEWNKLTSRDGSIDLGAIAEGGKVDVALRVTVDAAAPEGEGIVSANSEYFNDDESCGISEDYAKAEFDIVEPNQTPSPTPTPTPTPTPSASASTAAPVVTQRPNTPVQQGGTGGQLAATGSDDTLPQLAAAGAAVVLGAGAVFVARRRKADA
ncbi:LAETG motif-containing sortase-dependent surface protein [Streptomyces sp. NPDC007863]|uniref:LAETG motif-containing sortase-dependent surface protein n=1 Tax=Streptomyces sp. NPDC007863 TaxID=3154894 RepID=UPI0033CC004A